MKLALLLTALACTPLLRAADDKKDAAPAKEEKPADSKEAAPVNELPRVSAGDIEGVKKLIGKKAVVFGKVISAKAVEKSGISFLDLDGGKFTVVCFKDNYSKFEGGQSPANLYKGKDIEVTGEIFEYKKGGKGSPQPEIKLTEPSQVKVIEAAKPDKDAKGSSDKKDSKPEEKTDDTKRVPAKKFFK